MAQDGRSLIDLVDPWDMALKNLLVQFLGCWFRLRAQFGQGYVAFLVGA